MWELEWCDTDKTAKIKELLGSGWEPFSAANSNIYFRRKTRSAPAVEVASQEKEYLIKTGIIKNEYIGGE
jgi:hypothetical protein